MQLHQGKPGGLPDIQVALLDDTGNVRRSCVGCKQKVVLSRCEGCAFQSSDREVSIIRTWKDCPHEKNGHLHQVSHAHSSPSILNSQPIFPFSAAALRVRRGPRGTHLVVDC